MAESRPGEPPACHPDGRRALVQRLQSLADAGVEALPRVTPGVQGRLPVAGAARAETNPDTPPPPARRIAPVAVTVPPVVAARTGSDQDAALTILRDAVAACTRCAELACTRTQTVFGSGAARARICFFGEAPGADEDASGIPFVGRAGQLLTRIIEAIRLTRDEVYILNVLKCRPPANRSPAPDEVANCRPFFERQLEIIRPEFICCLGTTAAHALLGAVEPIGKLRGRWFSHGPSQVICTYHPSYLLRNPAAKRPVWEDMQALAARAAIDLSVD
ncbi:MAG: uracil-DNA glycosylase [Planctomycetia bacterium]|nr:uracil-DNA glycosylase [Planctomycetia bacterium]